MTGVAYTTAMCGRRVPLQQQLGQSEAGGHEIIVIERGSDGLFVATSEQNYAFIHPDLEELAWTSISVRDNQVYIMRRDNSTSLRRWDKLEESSRDLISDLRSDFIGNLAGLALTDVPRPARASKSRSSGASGAPKRQQASKSWRRNWQSSAPVYETPVGRSRQVRAATLVASGKFKIKRKPKNGKGSRKQQQQQEEATEDPEQELRQLSQPEVQPAEPIVAKPQQQQHQFNYYNLQQTELSKKLHGDVYHFDMSGNTLDVFSSSVSLKFIGGGGGASMLYRDRRYFSLSAPLLPLNVHRLFVQGDFVFFVYKNANVVAKWLHLLDPDERKLVSKARAQVKRLCQWQSPPPGFIFALPDSTSSKQQSKQQQ